MNDAVSRKEILDYINKAINYHRKKGIVPAAWVIMLEEIESGRFDTRKAFSPSGEQKESGTQRVRDFYKAWNHMETDDIYSAQTIASIIADVAGMLGIKVEEDRE